MAPPEFLHPAVAYCNGDSIGYELGHFLGLQVTFERFGVNIGVVNDNNTGRNAGTRTSPYGSWVSIYPEEIDKLITILEYYKNVYRLEKNLD